MSTGYELTRSEGQDDFPAPRPTDPVSLMSILADVLRLPEECLGMSFIYLNKYRKFQNNEDKFPSLDDYMLILACLSVASKATEAPRRVREFLLPAWQIMHRNRPDTVPLTCSSPTYDALRSALVRTELVLLRVLRFELRISTPFDCLPGYLSGVMREFNAGDTSSDAARDFDYRKKEQKEAERITDLMDTNIAKACKAKALFACRDYQLANYFQAKPVAAACIYTILQERGLIYGINARIWLREKISRSIDVADFEEAVLALGKG
ncbi:hypothetical protein B0J12DRAFT_646994 [Macrophomina phaseolina]|uniref:Cyclin N-terminal domain-containing protein n=1 Tax=Macrophomina phaseolina TaxID=35725 RepID=A0ABQ8GNB6_9PEZI|nr:hypothetical protein B0J12DRAFT_646994 [Macrophomina phaseolina]